MRTMIVLACAWVLAGCAYIDAAMTGGSRSYRDGRRQQGQSVEREERIECTTLTAGGLDNYLSSAMKTPRRDRDAPRRLRLDADAPAGADARKLRCLSQQTGAPNGAA